MAIAYAMTKPFYASHIFLFLSYFLTRHAATTRASPLFCNHLFRRELQAILCLAVILCMKSLRCISVEAFWADTLLYGKGVLFLLVCILDRHLAVWYLITFTAVFLLFQQPCYRGPGNVVSMTPLQLENQLLDGVTSETWLVEFQAAWSSHCIQASRIFTDLSLRYSSKDLHFASIDLGHFPKAAKKYDIGGDSMRQLPTYVLFEGGTEVSRIPLVNSDSQIVTDKVTKGMITKHFELDRRLISYLSKGYLKSI